MSLSMRPTIWYSRCRCRCRCIWLRRKRTYTAVHNPCSRQGSYADVPPASRRISASRDVALLLLLVLWCVWPLTVLATCCDIRLVLSGISSTTPRPEHLNHFTDTRFGSAATYNHLGHHGRLPVDPQHPLYKAQATFISQRARREVNAVVCPTSVIPL
ncbi:hypothetical protein BD413DRAFT_304803 [Trametes elegans]|nr:hypothetical protein BD413DRAFT_304803 [Trametes elegans]